MDKMKRFWISWYDNVPGKWELHTPWWISGERLEDGALTICAAVIATDQAEAVKLIFEAHDEPRPATLEFRFISEKPDDWSPFCWRFEPAPWMRWPGL